MGSLSVNSLNTPRLNFNFLVFSHKITVTEFGTGWRLENEMAEKFFHGAYNIL